MQTGNAVRATVFDLTPLPAQSARIYSACLWSACQETQCIAMLDAYRRCGGIARAEELSLRFSDRRGPCISSLARWIVERQVVCFEWDKQLWLPLFQFTHDTLLPRREMTSIVQELADALDQWNLALWFARPNAWLNGRSPANSINDNLPSVVDAARASRFVVNG